jgi:hypothetical protein
LEDLEKWLTQQREKIARSSYVTAMEGSVAAFEITFTLVDGKLQMKRVLVEGQPIESVTGGLIVRLGSLGSGPGDVVA